MTGVLTVTPSDTGFVAALLGNEIAVASKCFEIDRGTMPDARSDTFRQTSFEEKMRAYLTAHAGKQHERQFGWKTFRVLTVTTDHHRMQSMMEALRKLRIPHRPGAPLF